MRVEARPAPGARILPIAWWSGLSGAAGGVLGLLALAAWQLRVAGAPRGLDLRVVLAVATPIWAAATVWATRRYWLTVEWDGEVLWAWGPFRRVQSIRIGPDTWIADLYGLQGGSPVPTHTVVWNGAGQEIAFSDLWVHALRIRREVGRVIQRAAEAEPAGERVFRESRLFRRRREWLALFLLAALALYGTALVMPLINPPPAGGPKAHFMTHTTHIAVALIVAFAATMGSLGRSRAGIAVGEEGVRPLERWAGSPIPWSELIGVRFDEKGAVLVRSGPGSEFRISRETGNYDLLAERLKRRLPVVNAPGPVPPGRAHPREG